MLIAIKQLFSFCTFFYLGDITLMASDMDFVNDLFHTIDRSFLQNKMFTDLDLYTSI